MANAFLEYYRFNTKIAPDRTVLQRTKKKSGESFCEYTQWWHELATQVLPPMMEYEMIKWFIDNLKPPYYEKMISAQVTHFVSQIPIEESIDEGIISKKIVDFEALNSMIENKWKRKLAAKGKKLMFIWLTKSLKDQGVLFLLIQPQMPNLINNRFSQPNTLPNIQSEGKALLTLISQGKTTEILSVTHFMLICWRRS